MTHYFKTIWVDRKYWNFVRWIPRFLGFQKLYVGEEEVGWQCPGSHPIEFTILKNWF